MKKLIAFYSRADENYFGGAYRVIPVGNTEKAAQMLISDIDAAAAGKPNSPVHISFPHTLVEREST